MKAKKVIFTICARNYYGLAQVLKQSVLQHHDDVDFLVFIADGIQCDQREIFGPDAIDATTVMRNCLENDKFLEIAFKYNLTEYCTAIKPFCFAHVFDSADYAQAVYLDPDVFLFSSIDQVFTRLDKASIVLTPHIIFPSSTEGRRQDKGIMATGIFNLGFIGLSRSEVAKTFINWWGRRLLDQCFVDVHDALFTDQKWVDFVPALFPSNEVVVFRHPGANLAPWNFHERLVSTDAAGISTVQRRVDPSETLPIEHRVEPDPVIFVHFSGFDYKRLCSGEVAQYNIEGLSIYSDLRPLVDKYMSAIQLQQEIVLHYLKMDYAFGTFEDGQPILSFYRRLFRSAVESGLTFKNPFQTVPGSYYCRLSKSKLLSGRSRVQQLDKSNKHNLFGIEGKLRKFNFVMRLLMRLIGFSNYALLLRLMRPYSRPEAQLHLIDYSKVKL
jgi:hypothetical protein